LPARLVRCAGFLRIATAASATGEYTRSIFQVTTIALAASWIAAVVFVPYLGYKLLPDLARPGGKPSWLRRFLARSAEARAPRLAKWFGAPTSAPHRSHAAREPAIYQTPLYPALRRGIQRCVRHP